MAGIGSAKLAADQWLSLYSQVIHAMGAPSVAGFGTDLDGLEFAMPVRALLYPPGVRCPPPPNGPVLCVVSLSSVQYGTQAFPFDRSTDGNKTWDYNRDGVAHYGMLPDSVAVSHSECEFIDTPPIWAPSAI